MIFFFVLPLKLIVFLLSKINRLSAINAITKRYDNNVKMSFSIDIKAFLMLKNENPNITVDNINAIYAFELVLFINNCVPIL